MSARDEFQQHVKDALKHLYDYPTLEKNPLASRYWPEVTPSGPSRAQRLSRLLLESIEALNPPAASAKDTSRAQYYWLLVYRYVEEWAPQDILRELGLSRRQFFREQGKAIAMLADSLWEKLPQPKAPQQDRPSAEPGDLLGAEAQRFLARRKAVDVKEVVRGTLEIVGQLAEEHAVALESELDPRLPPIFISRTLLRQVFLKSLSYLITRPDARRIRLQVRFENQQVVTELTAEFDVPAARPGDARDCRAHDQDPVRRLVEIVGGHWQGMEKRPGGCMCRFSFPIDSKRILLVIEDNEAVIRAFRRYLTGHNYQVMGATTGAEALRLAREVHPTAITLDVMMPSQDGWETLQALKDDPATQHIPVIVCSVLEDPELARSLGAVAYLRKPITQSDLITALDSLNTDPGL